MNKILLSFLLIGLLGFSFISCEKKTPESIVGGEEGEEETSNPDISADEWTIMDETYIHFAYLSLWAKESDITLPNTYGEVRNFTKNYKNADYVLDALVERTPMIGPESTPVDRYSFIDRDGQVGEEIGEGRHRNIGVSLEFRRLSENSSDVGLFIRLVQKNSPAEAAGLSRGYQILSVDGETLSFTANASGQVSGSMAAANKLFSSDVSTMSARDWVTEQNKNMTIPSIDEWTIDPIIVNNVFELGGKKIGYMAYSSFVSVAGQINTYRDDLINLFAEFESEGINELIVDLRYNGGGATNAAELLTNLIVPTGKNGQTMYKYVTNDYLSRDGEIPPILIEKSNGLNLQRAYFLVTTSSASASELVINNLKPYMDVQVISTNNRGTYGKPVGSFPEPIEDSQGKVLATTYITSLKMVNAAGQGDYFSGLIGDKRNSSDAILRQLGDPQETMLNDALYHIQNGSYRVNQQSARIMRGNRSVPVPDAIDFQIDKNIQGLYNLEYKPVLKLDK